MNISYEFLQYLFYVMMCLPIAFVGLAFYFSLKKDRKELNDYDRKKIQAIKEKKAAEEREKQKYIEFDRNYSRRRRNND